MTPPAATAPPRHAATRAPAPAAGPAPRSRAPFSRPRQPRPPLITPRTIAVSFALHVVLLLAVLLAPAPERRLASRAPAGGPTQEVVDYLDVGEWGGMATDAAASLPEPAAPAAAVISAAAVDSVLRALPDPGPFPSRVPAGIPAAPAGQGGQPGAAFPGAAGGVSGGVPGAQPGGAGRGRSGPGGLGPEFGDPRLVVRPGAVAEAPVEDVERYRRHFEGRIQALNDSISGEAERQRRANDWTFTDRNGNRWGIDERGVVANGKHVPTPRPGFGRPQRDREDEARRERAQRGEIDRQAETIERDRHLRERGQATRERADREREEQRKRQGGTTP
ncbi:MAG: hypothetical protein KY467_11665 [Gemmatimonadetes bacterium]|nr:hypothetical protein [Gemmatimonadota bacterium]